MKKSIRIGALMLTLSLLVTLVSALSFDLNEDGKTSVWDLQLAVNQGKTDPAALQEALNGTDELHPNADGIYEIWSPLGLYHMAATAAEGNRYKLMADIDLSGAAWSPIPVFKGNLDGNGKTISHFTVTQAVIGSDGGSMGFIALLDHNGDKQSTVTNLHLQDISLTVPEADVRYIGLIAGSNRGIVENCTTVGIIHDSRTHLDEAVYIGTLVGRNCNESPAGKVVSGANLLTATAGSSNPEDRVTGLTSQVALDFAVLAEGSQARTIGIVGNTTAENIDTNMIWQDTSGSIAYKTALEQQRRQAVVDEMHRMGTVQWTTSEELSYTSSAGPTSTHSNIYIPGRTYTGVPYNNCGGGYVRFLSVMDGKDDQGRYVTRTGLENGIEMEDLTDIGFTTYAGNDCATAVGWSWSTLAPALKSNHGGFILSTGSMTPNEYSTPKYGIMAVGGYQVIDSDTAKYPNGQDARNTRTLIELNGGASGMAEFFAKASRGDALLYKNTVLNEATGVWESNGGHARMLAYDPVIIRDHAGKIDLETSYVITHEQGDGLYDCQLENGKYEQYKGFGVKETSWRIDFKYPLHVLMTQEGHRSFKAETGKHPGSGWGYVPVTIETFSYDGTLRTPYYDDGFTEHPIVLPNSGWYYSNYFNVCGEMTITDASGNVVYQKTEYVAPDGSGSDYQKLMLEVLFPDATDQLTAGQTYQVTVRFLAANGIWTTKINNKQFTYNG